MSLTSVEQVLTGYHGSVDDHDWVQDQIDETEDELSAKLGDLTAWAAADADRLRKLQRVTKRVVRRSLRNPDGLKTEQSGDYAYSRDPLVASGNVWISDADWRLLGVGSRRAGTIWLKTDCR